MLRQKRVCGEKTEANYTAFGAPLTGYSWDASNFRYGFNGQEKDNEVYGAGNLTTATFWEFDTRLGRRWDLDPLFKAYPGWSPYSVDFDNPIWHSDPNGDGPPPTITDIIKEGSKTSSVFSSLLKSNNINLSNHADKIFFGEEGRDTETEDETGKIYLTTDNDIKFQVIKLTHELTNRKNSSKVQALNAKVKEGKIDPKQYANEKAIIEVEGEINQIKVAAETGYRYKGKKFEWTNKLIDAYSKDKTIDLTKKAVPSTEHLKSYEETGKVLRAGYLLKHPKK